MGLVPLQEPGERLQPLSAVCHMKVQGGVSSLQRGKEFEHAGTLDSEFRGPDCDK